MNKDADETSYRNENIAFTKDQSRMNMDTTEQQMKPASLI